MFLRSDAIFCCGFWDLLPFLGSVRFWDLLPFLGSVAVPGRTPPWDFLTSMNCNNLHSVKNCYITQQAFNGAGRWSPVKTRTNWR